MNENRQSFKFKNCSNILQKNKYSPSFTRHCNRIAQYQLKKTSLHLKKDQEERNSPCGPANNIGKCSEKKEELNKNNEESSVDGVRESESDESVGREDFTFLREASVGQYFGSKHKPNCLHRDNSVTIIPKKSRNLSNLNKFNINLDNKLATKNVTCDPQLSDFQTNSTSNKSNACVESNRFPSFIPTVEENEGAISTRAVTEHSGNFRPTNHLIRDYKNKVSKVVNSKDNRELVFDNRQILNPSVSSKNAHSELVAKANKYTTVTEDPLYITYNDFTVNPINITTDATLQDQDDKIHAYAVVNEKSCKKEDQRETRKTNLVEKELCECFKSHSNPCTETKSSFPETENPNCFKDSKFVQTRRETKDSWTQYDINDTKVCEKSINVNTQTEFCQDVNSRRSCNGTREVKSTNNGSVNPTRQENSCGKSDCSNIRISDKSNDVCSDEKEFKDLCKYLFKDDCKLLANLKSFKKSEPISQETPQSSSFRGKVIEPRYKSECTQTKIIKATTSGCDTQKNKYYSNRSQLVADKQVNKGEEYSRRGSSCGCSETSLRSKEERDRRSDTKSSTKNYLENQPPCNTFSEGTQKTEPPIRRNCKTRKRCCLKKKSVSTQNSSPICSKHPQKRPPCPHKKDTAKCKVCRKASESDINRKSVTVVEPEKISSSEDSGSEICLGHRRNSSDISCSNLQSELSCFVLSNEESPPYKNTETSHILGSNCGFKETSNISYSHNERLPLDICSSENTHDPAETTCPHQNKGQCDLCYIKLKITENPNLSCPHREKGLCDLCCSILKIKEPEENACLHQKKGRCDLCVSNIYDKAPVEPSCPGKNKEGCNSYCTKVRTNKPLDQTVPNDNKERGESYRTKSDSLDNDCHNESNSQKSKRKKLSEKSRRPSQESCGSLVATETQSSNDKKVKRSNSRNKKEPPNPSSSKRKNNKKSNRNHSNLDHNSFNVPEACLKKLDKFRDCLIDHTNKNRSITPNYEQNDKGCTITRSVVTDKKELNIAKGTVKYIKLTTDGDVFVCKEKEEQCDEEAQLEIRNKSLSCSSLSENSIPDDIVEQRSNSLERTLQRTCEDNNSNLKSNYVPISIPVPKKLKCESNLIVENKIRDNKPKESKKRSCSKEERKVSSKGRTGVFVFIPCDDNKSRERKVVELYASLGTLRNPKQKESQIVGFSQFKQFGKSAGHCFKKCWNHLSDASFSSKNRQPLKVKNRPEKASVSSTRRVEENCFMINVAANEYDIFKNPFQN